LDFYVIDIIKATYPNLSPTRREALNPTSLIGKGGRGVRSFKSFLEMFSDY